LVTIFAFGVLYAPTFPFLLSFLSPQNLSNMGTRSRLIIRRKTKEIRLWMHWDGYFDGVGNDLVKQVKKLLEKYTAKQICNMIETLVIDYEGDTETFDQNQLADFIEGKVTYANDMCDDVEYTYTLDANRRILIGKSDGTNDVRILSFVDIKAGKMFDNFVSPDSDDEYEPTSEEDDEKELSKTNMTLSQLIAALQKGLEMNPELADEYVYYNASCDSGRSHKLVSD
jgi:hypothetical protein